MLSRIWKKKNPFAPLVGMKIGWTAVESSMEITQKLKMDLPFDSVIPLLGIYLKKPKTLIWKNVSTPMFIAALFTIAKIWKQSKCTSRWVDKTTMGHLHNGILLGQKKKKILPFATSWMDLENMLLSEISQLEKDKYYVISLICGI